MSQRKLTVKVSSVKESLSHFKKVWEKAARGEKIAAPLEILSFENSSLLMKTLSPRRLELLQQLHTMGKSSIRALAKQLNRDYSNVHQDIKALHHVGLVVQEKTSEYFVPWEKIIAEIPMTMPSANDHKPHKSFKRKAAA